MAVCAESNIWGLCLSCKFQEPVLGACETLVKPEGWAAREHFVGVYDFQETGDTIAFNIDGIQEHRLS